MHPAEVLFLNFVLQVVCLKTLADYALPPAEIITRVVAENNQIKKTVENTLLRVENKAAAAADLLPLHKAIKRFFSGPEFAVFRTRIGLVNSRTIEISERFAASAFPAYAQVKNQAEAPEKNEVTPAAVSVQEYPVEEVPLEEFVIAEGLPAKEPAAVKESPPRSCRIRKYRNWKPAAIMKENIRTANSTITGFILPQTEASTRGNGRTASSRGKAPCFFLMAANMTATGGRASAREREHLPGPTGTITRANGKTTCDAAWALKKTRNGTSTPGTGKTTSGTAGDGSIMPTAVNVRVNGKKTGSTAQELSILPGETNTRVNGGTAAGMAVVDPTRPREHSTTVNGHETSETATGYTSLLTGIPTGESGKKANVMGKEHTAGPMVIATMENGMMANNTAGAGPPGQTAASMQANGKKT